jgi:hypothetical protein
MKKLSRGARRRVMVCICALALALPVLAFTGCTLHQQYIEDGNGHRLGEAFTGTAGITIVLYRSTGGHSYNVNTTDALLALYKNYRQTHNIQGASTLTLRFMRRYCNGDDRCESATSDGQWSDFRNDSLVPVDHTPGACIAVSVRGGANWTTRSRTDSHCIPN